MGHFVLFFLTLVSEVVARVVGMYVDIRRCSGREGDGLVAALGGGGKEGIEMYHVRYILSVHCVCLQDGEGRGGRVGHSHHLSRWYISDVYRTYLLCPEYASFHKKSLVKKACRNTRWIQGVSSQSGGGRGCGRRCLGLEPIWRDGLLCSGDGHIVTQIVAVPIAGTRDRLGSRRWPCRTLYRLGYLPTRARIPLEPEPEPKPTPDIERIKVRLFVSCCISGSNAGGATGICVVRPSVRRSVPHWYNVAKKVISSFCNGRRSPMCSIFHVVDVM
ncbi:hypothetical protein B0T18DRAFT_398263 [Schizothecium vesticola]|uniref:Secreted protein n=1 Tax=Schizothecium vesticola TaxID=314040 RepID=A0AA40KCP3_9PEZI|nr:hypothetical protein B0T18DRAFT_398263 [Schizothecium vesticola]